MIWRSPYQAVLVLRSVGQAGPVSSNNEDRRGEWAAMGRTLILVLPTSCSVSVDKVHPVVHVAQVGLLIKFAFNLLIKKKVLLGTFLIFVFCRWWNTLHNFVNSSRNTQHIALGTQGRPWVFPKPKREIWHGVWRTDLEKWVMGE